MADLKYTATVDTSQGVRNLQNLQNQTSKTNSAFSGLQKGLVALGAGAALGGFTLAVRSAMKSVDDLAKSARALGMSSASFQALARSADLAGVSSQQLSATVQRLQVNLGQGLARGTGPAVDAINMLGLSLSEIAQLPTDQQIEKITEALKGVENPAQRSALAVELLGRQGPRMLEAADNMARLKSETEALGLSLTNVDTAGIEAANDAISELVFIFQSTLQAIAAELAPYITAIANAIKNSVLESGNFARVWIDNIIPAIRVATNAVVIFASVLISGKIVAALGSIVSTIILIGRAIATATTLMTFFNTVVGKNPIIKLIGLVLGLASALGVVFGIVDPLFEELNAEAAKLTEELEKQQAEIEGIGSSSQNLLAPAKQHRDEITKTVEQYRKIGEEYRKNFEFQTRTLGLTEEQRVAAGEENTFLDVLETDWYNDAIKAAIAEVTAEYEKQLPLVEQMVAARQQELRIVEAQQNLEQAREATVSFIEKLNDGIDQAESGLQSLNMNKLDRQLFDIRNRLGRDLTVQVRRLQSLMTATNAGDIQNEIQRITIATDQAIAEQERLAKLSYAHQRTFSFGWKQAFEDYADAATNSAELAGRVFKQTMQGMEDMIVDFVKTGKFEWKNFVSMMLEELLRAQIRQIFAQLLGSMNTDIGSAAEAIGGSGSGADGSIADQIAGGMGGAVSQGLGITANNPVYVWVVNWGAGATDSGIQAGPTSPLTIGSSFGVGSMGVNPIQKQLTESMGNMLIGSGIGSPSTSITAGASGGGGSWFDQAISGISDFFAGEPNQPGGIFGSGSGGIFGGSGSGGSGSGMVSLDDPIWDDFVSSGAAGGAGRTSSDWFVDSSGGTSVAYPITDAGRRAAEQGFSPIGEFGGFFANGGMLGAGKWGIAGEAGPELITGPAQITPMDQFGGSTNVTYNINAVDARSFKEMLAQDPGYLYGLTLQGSRGVPVRR